MKMGHWMLEMVRSEICGETGRDKPQQMPIDSESLSSLYTICEGHDMAHIVANALERVDGLQDGEGKQAFDKQRMLAVFRYRQMDYEFDRFCETMEAVGIDFIPLKGAVLRHLYPQPWMRTGCDLDFLVREKDLDRAIRALKERLDYKYEQKSAHDVSLLSPNRVHIELHFELVEEARANGCARVLERVWENYSLPVPPKTHQYAMTDGMFYLYHIAHMAKHIEAGGCGVRPFLDLWILNHRKDGVDVQGRETLLREAKLDAFARAAEKLSRVWFSGEERDALSERLEHYILRAGAYGTVQNKIVMRQVQQGGNFGYLMSRIFQPYSYMKKRYPVLQKHKWLLPIYHVRRWFGLLSPKKFKRSVGEWNINRSISTEQRSEGEILIELLEL